MQWLKQSTAVTLKIGPFLDDTDGKTAETGLTITQAEVRLSKNGGDIAQKNEASALTHDELGVYGCPIDTTDTNTLGRLQLWVHESGALPVWHEYMVVPANVYDSLCSTDKLQVDAVEISSATAAADSVEANIGNLDASIATVDTVVDAIKAVTDNLPNSGALSDLATILTDTGELQTDWVDGGRLDLLIDAIKAVTDALPDSGALSDLATILTDTNELQTDDVPGLIAALNDLTAAQVNTEVDTALADIDLDHLIQVTAGAEEPTDGSYLDQIMHKDGSQTFDPTADSLEAIRDRGDAAWTTGGGGSISDILNVQPLIPESIDLANTAAWRLALMLLNSLDDLPTTAEITPGTIDIDRKAIGGTSWSSVVSGAACSEAAGLIYYDEVFDSGTGYAEGDSIRITWKGQKITVAANDYEISDATGRVLYTEIRQTERGTESAALASVCTEARLAELAAANLPADVDAILADTNELQGDWTNGGRLDLLIDAILADTGTDGVVISAATANAIADALLKRDWTSVSGEAARSVLNALRRLRNKAAIVGSTLTINEEDDSTPAWTATVTTDSGADPVTAIDPT